MVKRESGVRDVEEGRAVFGIESQVGLTSEAYLSVRGVVGLLALAAPPPERGRESRRLPKWEKRTASLRGGASPPAS
jgi:hypothetical protein